ncbi:post-GPI attachment to proteins factor 2-like isoform X1 [Drosophila simulans]|uniref:GD15597 n=3 Tax=melanogaster subgroup TaxID=32351 RepID=B4R7C0_DROSI|nr:post-GPI attachment to proteins factor 2-like isoform X1 [Drosophila simulans]XP_033172388.1 post-GPI attachment to proteins factor 2-like isoform X1 [Drosophila mauritiana]EDX18361.1 GD15597 [Drosophila simulans]
MQQSTGAATSSAADSGMGATDLVSRCGGDGGGGGGNSCSGGSSDPAAINTTISSKQADAREPQEEQVAIHYLASFHELCVVTALLPLVTLFTCFVTAYVFQYDDVHETHCRVYNIIPSISAITGVSPQRYFWRFSIALHIGPRIPIAFVYKNYYRSQLRRISPAQVPQTSLLITLILVLNCIEIASLGGVTYISNRENYPVHERIFITFMVCSLCYMLATIKLNSILNAGQALSEKQLLSIKWKKILFAVSILSTVGLLVFFAKHRFYCHDLAFSWFAFFEYLIAIANMLFHFTIIWDFPSQFMMIVQGPRENLAQYLSNRPKLD